MCGLAGIVDLSSDRRVEQADLDRMTDSLAHRGPDGRGTLIEPGIALGHRRLSIIDLAGASQPMDSADGRYVTVFNGEIYNYRAIRADLEAKGHSFRLNSDTEVLLEAYRAWGPDMLPRLTGMFAVAIWDRQEKSLFLARDRFGVKPLYLCRTPDDRLLFGSELKAILTWPDLPRRADARAISDYFTYGYVPDDKSLVLGVRQLPPAHYALISRGRIDERRYWDIAFDNSLAGRDVDALTAELDERLTQAVGHRMVADVEVAAFLSGGVDSSAVVAHMARLTDDPFKSITIGFDEKGFDESEYARAVARRYNTSHLERIVTPDDHALADRLAGMFDDPFADASAIPTYRLCELAAEHVKVALSGDGADEAMAGYRRYNLFANEERARALIPGGVRRPIFSTLGAMWPKLDMLPRPMRLKSTFQALGMSSGEGYAHAVSVTTAAQRRRLFSAELSRAMGGYRSEQLYADSFDSAQADDSLSRAQYADMRWYLPGDILTKVDRTSMAVGLEAREPLLDHELVGWMARLPPALRLKSGSGKWLMKRAMRPLMPDGIVDRPKKGFVVPISRWFREALADDAAALADSPALGSTGWLSRDEVARLASDHRRGLADNSRILWQLTMLDRSLSRLGLV